MKLSNESINFCGLFIVNFFTILFICRSSNYFRFNIFGFNNKNLINFILKINSIIHGLIIWYISIRYLSNNVEEETFLHYIEMSKGYLIYDTLMTLYYHKYVNGLKLMIIHHSLFFVALHSPLLVIYKHLAAQALKAEITNVFLYFGWFLLKKRWNNSIIFFINAGILLTLFLQYRVLNFTNLFIVSLSIEGVIMERIFIFVLMIMNIYWFVRLLEKFFISLLNFF